ncbi:MAG TPA: N-acetyl-gamma-glutamyl-phosphate reductase, partial [Deltaproteobacteria bacterium]|nr:N-acetyl-gamma-glutamyl-phosphate reductase [Deltaproteobacteria bacterium]
MIRVSIVGGSGYTGGELLRLLLFHPECEVQQITSERFSGKFVHNAHPNLRGATRLKYCAVNELEPCDLLFLCLPHGRTMTAVDRFEKLAPRLIDLSADFRLTDPKQHQRWYGTEHTRPDLLGAFAYGIPEINREAIQSATRVACAGCNATVSTLAVRPFTRRDLVESIVIEVKAGSSEGGNASSGASH